MKRRKQDHTDGRNAHEGSSGGSPARTEEEPGAAHAGQLAALCAAACSGRDHDRVQIRSDVRHTDRFPELQSRPWDHRQPLGRLEMV